MPIRFRCAYCNQLMGIASRKAGTVVKCPKCAGEIIVPVPDGEQPPAPPAGPTGGQAFEEDDFARYLDEPANGSTGHISTAAPPTPGPKRVHVPPPPERRGLVLSWGMLIVSIIVVILLLIAMFVLGMVIGRKTPPAPPGDEPKDAAVLLGSPHAKALT